MKQLFFFIILCFILEGCATNNKPIVWASYTDVDTANLNQLENLYQKQLSTNEADEVPNPIRLQALKEAALTLGAQGALAERANQVNSMLEKNRKNLDQIFNFNTFLLTDNVLAPVIVEGRTTFNLQDDDTIRIADKTYRIIKQARFATTVPNWREYLYQQYPKPAVPDPTLLPREDNEVEVKTWKEYVKVGWDQGGNQADQIFAENLARIKRDFNGMALYMKLLNQNMISPPQVAKTELGITGGGDEMSINDRFKRITEHPGLQANGEEWKPAVAEEITTIGQSQPNSQVIYSEPIMTGK